MRANTEAPEYVVASIEILLREGSLIERLYSRWAARVERKMAREI